MFLQQRPLKYREHRKMIIEMTDFCLKNNIFAFNCALYRQANGTAMGSCFAPSFANLLMGYWEHTTPLPLAMASLDFIHVAIARRAEIAIAGDVLYNGIPKKITQFLTCSTSFVIYAIECPCKLWYIGSTTCTAKKRVLESLRAITNHDPKYPVTQHFGEKHFSNVSDLSFLIFEHIPKNPRGGDRVLTIRQRESLYIIDFQTKIPGGLSMDEELSIHLKEMS